MNTKPFLQSSFSKLKKLNIKIWGWEKCYFPTLLWIWGWIHFFICCMVYEEGSKYEHLFRSATICIVKNSQSQGFHIKRTDLPFSRLKRVSKMSREGNIEELYLLAIFYIFGKSLFKKVYAFHWALNMNPRNKLPLFPTRLLWGTSLEAFVGWNWGLKRGRSWNLRAVWV